VRTDHVTGWVMSLGVDDVLTARFAVIDFARYEVMLAPTTVTVAGDAAATGWTLDVGSEATVFAFLKQHAPAGAGVYMSASYAAAA
jgi:hypothetical protein